ncbi:hypothetical protein QQX98_008929 [Neonectria punicea]|uniref:Uncharacterized protein n=1 Tax=Neonectria punicea TaxID=979145 RepID=A0ABR1GTQ6_9HYPO
MSAIENKSILVIGGLSGIGYGFADRALAEGARLHIASSNASRVQQSVDGLKQKYSGADISGHTRDLANPDVEKNPEKLLESAKPLDHIAFTAGDALAVMPLDQIDLEAIHKAGHIRFAVPLLLAKLAPRHLKPG